MRNGIFAALFLFIGLQAQLAQADGSLSGAAFFPSLSLKQETGTVGGDQNALHQDFRLGYILSSGWYFGVLYSRTATIGSNGINQTSIGNSIGYFLDYFSIIGTYYLTSRSQESSTARSIIRSEGSGYQFDFSYMFPASGSIYIGPVLSYRILNYGKEEEAGAVINTSQAESYIYPFFGAIFLF